MIEPIIVRMPVQRTKSVNNGIDFEDHNVIIKVPTAQLPKCVEDGVLKEFLE